ncbi:MAG: metallophosphoesterase [Flavobacteriales bacterium]|nr:metallophosphoesterase [Flavobacteriales bacterium]
MIRIGKIVIGFFSAVVLVLSTTAQTSPFNGRTVVTADSIGHYRLLFGGHFHGSSFGRSGYPAATLLANLERINALEANALLSTGDLFLSADKDSAHYVDAFFKKLNAPLFNAPGNHDVEGKVYLQSYGPTFSWFDLGGDRIILLDTELDNGNLEGEQLAMLRDQLRSFEGSHVFIVSHRPIWSEGDDRYAPLFAGNTRSILGNNYATVVYPMLEEVARRAKVFWISGSMAGMAPASIFFQEHAPGITYIQCALRDEPRDALLVADVKNEHVEWKGLSLTGQTLAPPTTYTAEYWQANRIKVPEFNWRLLPYLVRKTVSGPQFWFGAIVALIVAFLIRRFYVRGF